MSLLTDASLILTPNAVKEGKLYSIIPSNGNGDMTVVRATATATRTNELGLIEPTPYNLVTYSEMFADASWLKTNSATVTANTDISPNGTLTADRLTAGAIFSQIQNIATVLSGNAYTSSVWIKRITGTGQVYIRSIENVNTPITITNDWVRYSVTTTSTSTTGRIGVVLQTSGDVVAIWGAQLVQGSVPKDYFPTTDRLNVPILNYDVAGGCPSTLVEPQRTNLLLNSVWAGGGSLPTSWLFNFSTGTSTPVTSIKNPNVTAYRFITSTTRQDISQTFALVLNQVIAFSCYVESAIIPIPVSQMLRIGPVATANGTVVFLKNNVVITSTTNVEAGFTYSAVLTCTTAGDFQFRIGSGVNSNITGDITISMPQVELGTGSPSITSYSTSFIPTTIQAITRNTSIIPINNIYKNNLITSAGGTWFIELNNNFILTRDAVGNGIWIGDNSSSSTIGNSLNIRHNGSSARLIINKTVGGTLTSLVTTPTNTVKIAIDWNGTTADIFVNGVKQITATSFITTNMEFLNISAVDVPKYIKSMMLFPRPLTDSECIALTTL